MTSVTPSISRELLERALNFAAKYTKISEEEKHIITHTKKSTLYNNNTPWRKKDNNFDVTMGSYDGAETCELVGLYLQSQLNHLNINVGLYRDDGLATSNCTPKQTEKIKQQMCKIRENKLKVSIEANKKVVNFLDITLDMKNNLYKQYHKPNDNTVYVNKHSNHPLL